MSLQLNPACLCEPEVLHDVFSEIDDGGVVQLSCSYALYDALDRHKMIITKYISLESQVSVL